MATQIKAQDIATLDGNIAMGSNKITGLAAGTASTDAAAFGQTKILQVLGSSLSTDAVTTSGTFVDSGMFVDITPSSTSSKILIWASGTGESGASNSVRFTFARDTTNIGGTAGLQTLQSAGATDMRNPFSMVFLDSPASVSSIRYKVQLLSVDGATSVAILGNNRPAQMIVQEVNGL